MSETTLGILSNTTFTGGIVAGVPSNVVVAHKYGERSIGQDFAKQQHFIADLSEYIYQQITE